MNPQDTESKAKRRRHAFARGLVRRKVGEAERRAVDGPLPVVEAEVERIERDVGRVREVSRATLEQQRVADAEHALRADRRLIRAAEHEAPGAQLEASEPPE